LDLAAASVLAIEAIVEAAWCEHLRLVRAAEESIDGRVTRLSVVIDLRVGGLGLEQPD
jgi:hypothetical protein